ncbi:protein transport protein gos1 [Yamadazyma tenuis]|uniref:Golgi SNAP receptor complex member 1 n=1 Tax=Candida tenuis (strain ATCC 10573 / BCRC 21748 / CBS 615 / JCM 9827 / NBRC 10315 / NRRL Y-1498 / VKM Y-70) TaxID=590646 RepID=G3BEI3_CANTC|nr:V-snare-domain-containing protein [Yamadazyma tenuis ATCC 10573]EGV60548.1 V-snare-domain-containing protein [Yamadazyma tenuis ATCC 10573]WEJ94207.1 protein transport protein gos1 [Yamadazyma tenuis]
MSTFTQIRNQILVLEKQTDSWLTKYSAYEKNLSIKEDVDQESNITAQLHNGFARREELIDKLNRINEFENLSTSKLQQLTRHKEILIDHKQIFARLAGSIQEIKNKNNLLFSIRSDLNSHKQRSDQRASAQDVDAHDYILDESVRVGGFNDIANNLLASAYRTRDELMSQRGYLNSAQSRMSNTLQRVPGIGTLISRINTRRRRDTFILATVIAACILLLFFV